MSRRRGRPARDGPSFPIVDVLRDLTDDDTFASTVGAIRTWPIPGAHPR